MWRKCQKLQASHRAAALTFIASSRIFAHENCVHIFLNVGFILDERYEDEPRACCSTHSQLFLATSIFLWRLEVTKESVSISAFIQCHKLSFTTQISGDDSLTIL